MKLKKFATIISLVLAVIVFSTAINITVFGINQRWRYSFETTASVKDWIARYGGNISRVKDSTSPNGDYCLKMTNRPKAWTSPAIKLDDILEQGGPGYYTVSVWVKVTTFGETGRNYGRSIIRGVESTSISHYYEPNYFSVIQPSTIQPNTWTCIQGNFSVTSDDIHRGTFYWMLDCIDPAEGQILYIDDFHLSKTSDVVKVPGEDFDITGFAVNDKPFLDYYYYENMPTNYSEDERAAWYYDRLNSAPLYFGEVVFTFSHAKYEELVNDYLNKCLNKWWKDKEIEQLNLTQEATEIIISEIIKYSGNVPAQKVDGFISTIKAAKELKSIVGKLGNLYKSDLNRLALTFADARDEGGFDTGAQDSSTVSIYLMRSDLYKYEYKIVHSSQRGVLDRNQYGELTEDTYVYLLNDLMSRLTDGYVWDGVYNEDGSPRVYLSYFQRPSINKVLRGYSYINEYNYLTMGANK